MCQDQPSTAFLPDGGRSNRKELTVLHLSYICYTYFRCNSQEENTYKKSTWGVNSVDKISVLISKGVVLGHCSLDIFSKISILRFCGRIPQTCSRGSLPHLGVPQAAGPPGFKPSLTLSFDG